MKKTHIYLAIVCSLLTGWSCRADVSLPALFSDHMVLQQGVTLPVWGWAEAGEKVAVELGTQKLEAVADAGGKWRLDFTALKAQSEPLVFKVSGKNTIELKDVLVGEVWLCSGQSNMERQLGLRGGQQPIDNWEAERNTANFPEIRHFLVGGARSPLPADRLNGSWAVCSPQTVSNFTAVGFFLARDLYQKFHVPIGIIHSSSGGTSIELWTRREAVANEAALAQKLAVSDKNLADYQTELPEWRKNGSRLMQEWKTAAEAAKAAGQPEPPRPPDPNRLLGNTTFGALHNGMITPLAPYAIKGVAWYQGESNANEAQVYARLLELMIGDWRKEWGNPVLPFLLVQIAPHKGMKPEIREAQLEVAQKVPQTALIVITDCGNAEDIHPTAKQPVGARLALAARGLAYGEVIEYSGPVYDAMTVSGNKALLSFKHLGTGLEAKDGALKGFEISADGKTYVPAQAEITGNTIEVWAESVTQPKTVRYGWANVPDVNLFNKEGLPASPFRTAARE